MGERARDPCDPLERRGPGPGPPLREIGPHLRGDLLGLERELAGGAEDEGLADAAAEVEALEGTDDEGAGLAGAALGLGDDVPAADEGGDGTLLDRGGLLEAVAVDAAQEVVAEGHLVEGGEDGDPGGEGLVVEAVVVRGGGGGGRGGRVRGEGVVHGRKREREKVESRSRRREREKCEGV